MHPKSEMDITSEKKSYSFDITRTKTLENDKPPLFDVEISGGWSVKPLQKLKPVDQLFHFSVFFCLLVLAFYVIAVHMLLYYETQDTSNLKRKVEFAFTLNEQLKNTLQSMKFDMDNVMKELQDLKSELTMEKVEYSNDDHDRHRRSVNASERPHKKNRRSRTKTKETIAVQFRTYEPFQFERLPMEGVLGPWGVEPTLGKSIEDAFEGSFKFHRRHVEISVAGLYFIYSQVTYTAQSRPGYYTINVISSSNGTSETSNESIAQCSSFASFHISHDISCYTSAIHVLYPKDIVYLQQMTVNVTVNFEIDMTFFGLILLNEI